MLTVSLYFLGSPHFERQEKTISLIRRRRSIALLAYLAMTAQPQSRERLTALLWPESDAKRARANLRRDLSYLKRQLGEDLITADREQIQINREASFTVDARQFAENMAFVQQHSHPPGNPCIECLPRLTETVNLYRDEFMVGYNLPDSPEFDEWQFFQRESLRQSLADGLQLLISWHQADGEIEAAIPYGRRWVALDSLHEPAQRCLIKLYAQADSQSAALRQYDLFRELLQEELGVEPEPETTALFEAIKTKRFPDTDSPALVSTAAGEKTVDLPLSTTPFIGRAKELNELNQLLRNSAHGRLFTITGPGGIGKTRLALQLAATMADDYTAIHFVPLAPVPSVEGIVNAIAEKVDCRFFGVEEPKQQLLTFLRHKKMLLILDNFEHLLSGAEIIVDLLHHASQLTLLVTSRERLNLSDETVYALFGLTLPESTTDLETSDAVKLLRQRAHMVRPEITFSPEDDAAIARICSLVQGMPLAIVLAASWLDMLSIQEVEAEISRCLDFLTTEMRDVPPRQRSIRAVFDASWKRLPADERQMFMKLSVFCGGFTREAAGEVTGGNLPQLRRLINKSFVAANQNQRYELHELLRQFAAGQLAASLEHEAAANNAHCVYYSHFIHEQTQWLLGGEQREALAAIAREYDNIRKAWNWAIQEEKLAEIQLALRPLQLFCQFQSRYKEGLTIWEAACAQLERLSPSPARDRILEEILVYRAWLLIRFGQLDQAEAILQETLSLYGQNREEIIAGYGTDPLTPLSLIATIRGDYETAVTYGEQSVEANQGKNHVRNLYNAYYVLTSATVAKGDYSAAQTYAQQAYHLINQVNDRWYLAYILIEMGKIALALNDIESAQEHFTTSYQLRDELEDPEGKAIALTHLGQVQLQKQNYAEAKSCYQESFVLYQEINDKGGIARTYQGLGQIACAQGEIQSARNYLGHALRLATDMNFVSLIFSTLNSIGKLYMETEQLTEGLALFSFVSQHTASDHASQTEAGKQLQIWTFEDQPAVTDWQPTSFPSPAQDLTDVVKELLHYLDSSR